MIHLGLGASHNDLDDDQARFRARTLIRNGPAVLHNIVAQARVVGGTQDIINPEFFMNIGPLSIMAEYTGTGNVTRIRTTPTQSNVNVPGVNSSPTATTCRRCTSSRASTVPTAGPACTAPEAAPTRVVPLQNFFWVPGRGCTPTPLAAAPGRSGARYSYSST